MASNDGYVNNRNVPQQRIEVKEEVENTNSSTEACSSTGTNTNDLDEFIKTLSYDEIVSSIEIVKQLQQASIDTDKSEIEEQCAGNHTDIKQEKESESVSDNHPEESLKNKAFRLQDFSGSFKSENENLLEDRAKENSVQTSNNVELSIVSKFLGSLPLGTESSASTSSFNYKAVESTGHLKQEYLELKKYTVPFMVCTNDNKKSEEVRYSSSKETIFKNTESNEETNRYNSIVTASPSGCDDNIIKRGCNEVESSGQFTNEFETNCQEPLIDSAVEAELSGSKREYNLYSKLYQKESSQEKKRVRTKSRTKLKTDSFSALEDLTKSDPSVQLGNCQLCEKQFFSQNDLIIHEKIHSGEKPFKYKICANKSTQNSSFKTHVRTHTGDKPFQCELCGYKCTVRGSLRLHMRTHTGDKPFQCELCGYKCTVRGNLRLHMRTHTGDKPFQCEICGYKCNRLGNLQIHMRTHTTGKPFQCELCTYKSTQSGNLKRHMRTHTGDKPFQYDKAFQCDLCGYKCTVRGNLRLHMRTHTGDKPFQCELCGYKCTVRGSLRLHMRTHTGDKPFQCELCGYKCTVRGSLRLHMKTHTGEKPFECEVCGYKCTIRGNLRLHMSTHTGEKPFLCELCGCKCTHSGGLKMHMRTHTGDKPFQCELCGYKSTRSRDLKRHMGTHTGDKTFSM